MALVICGCDFIYGVNRHAVIPEAPDFAYVERVLHVAPGVEDVEYSRTEGGRPLRNPTSIRSSGPRATNCAARR